MSDTTSPSDRDTKTGRFLPGNAGNGGRKPGQRNKLGEQYIADLAETWQRFGIQALERTAIEEPSVFCRIIASLLPRDVSLTVGVDVVGFAQSFQQAMAVLGVEQPKKLRPLPGQKPTMIEVVDARRRP